MKNYHIFYKDELVMDVSFDSNTLIIKKYTDNVFKLPFVTESRECFHSFIKSRCYEDGRADLSEILAKVGMKTNNPYEWVEKTHGLNYADFFWIKLDGDNTTYDEVKIR